MDEQPDSFEIIATLVYKGETYKVTLTDDNAKIVDSLEILAMLYKRTIEVADAGGIEAWRAHMEKMRYD